MACSTLRCCLLLIALLQAPGLRAQEQITWLTPNFSLGTGPALNEKTMVGPLLDYLNAHWGGATQQQVLVVNAKRGWNMIRAGDNACHLVALRTPEREALAYFVNTHLVPPVQLIVRTAALPMLPRNAAGEVELERLWQQARLHGALIDGRSYGPGLDAQFAQRPAGSMDSLSPADFGTRILQMVAAGRIDYTPGYDFELQLQKELFPALQELSAVPLQGHSELQVSGVACPRNAWGGRVAQRLRELLAMPAGIAALKASFDPRLSTQTRARYGARIAAYYERLPAELARPGALD